LIFDKPHETLSSINTYFPDEIKKQINEEIEFILNFKENDKDNDWTLFNNYKYSLIKKLYSIFINKRDEILDNNSTLNLSLLDSKEISDKIEELQNKFYSYEPLNVKKITITNTIEKLSQDIQTIIQEISKEEINLKKDEDNFVCFQCEKNNQIEKESIKDKNVQYLIKCEGCSMLYIINII